MLREGNVTVMVSDMDSAIQFYVEKLGLTLKARYSDQFAQVVAPGLTIALHPADKQGRRSVRSEGLSIGLRVDNLERTMKDLKGKGVKFSRIVEDGPVRLASFKDPDGNPLYLAESRW
jgi:catechol 2,3-dioxygenase-like lactoylglutathione lyase family enzyme